MQEFVPLFENLVTSSPLWVPVLATAYVLLTAAFSIFGDQLGWLWRVSISAPIGTAAIAVLLLSRERLGSSLAIFGVALIGLGVPLIGGGVALIVDNGRAPARHSPSADRGRLPRG